MLYFLTLAQQTKNRKFILQNTMAKILHKPWIKYYLNFCIEKRGKIQHGLSYLKNKTKYKYKYKCTTTIAKNQQINQIQRKAKEHFFCWFLDFMFSGWYLITYIDKVWQRYAKLPQMLIFMKFMSDFKI